MEENSTKTTIPEVKEIKSKLKVNKTVLLVAGLVILTGVLLAVSLSSKNVSPLPILNREEEAENTSTTDLSISEDVRTSSTSGNYEVDVLINSNENMVTGVQLELSYDPKVLTNVDITTGDFLLDPVVILKNVDITTGKISFVLGSQLGEPGVDGSGTVATISFRKAGNAETTINFLPQTLVTAEGSETSVLREATSGIISTLPTSTGSAE